MAEDDGYTKDGTVDYCGNPANKKETGTWRACPFILGNECCERLAYYGMSTNLVLYFKNRLHQHSATASKNVSNWSGTCYITPLIGAFLADSYLGRYWTIAVWIQDNVGWGWGFGIPAVAMAIAVVSFFSGTRLYRNQKPGGSALTRICQVVLASIRKYHVEVPSDTSLLYETSEDESAIKGSRKLDHTNELRFFDKAAVVGRSDKVRESTNPWRLCTVTQVEELKSVLRLLPVWATGIIFSTVYVALGQYLSSLLVTIVTKISTKNGSPGWIPDNLNFGHIDYFFWLLSLLSVLNLIAFLLVSMLYTYKRPVGTLR
ncbi:hypothetical protein ACSQ67_011865 [Phaseolus vulgaris]